MEKINIAELLKDCPQGMELDCTMFKNLEFDHIDKDNGAYNIICRVKSGYGYYNTHTFTEYGCYSTEKYSKCVIFPKGKTTWEGFVPPCKFKDGDVLFHSDSASNGIFIFKEILQRGSIQKVICYCDYDSEDGFCLGENHTCCWTDSKILRLATKEQRDILFQKMKEAGYKWNPETKILEKLIEPKFKVGDRIKRKDADVVHTIKEVGTACYVFDDLRTIHIHVQDNYELVPNKFDINTLVPFESRVLVRNAEGDLWKPAIYGFSHSKGCYVVGGVYWGQCIPYEANKELLGTTNNPEEYGSR